MTHVGQSLGTHMVSGGANHSSQEIIVFLGKFFEINGKVLENHLESSIPLQGI